MAKCKRNRLCAVMLALALTLTLVSCQGTEDNAGSVVDVYYAVSQIDASAANAKVARPLRIKLPDGSDAMDFAFSALLSAPEDASLYSVFPAGIEFLSVTVEDGCVILGLSREWENATGLSKTIAEYCMLKTALQFDGVTSLRWETQSQDTGAALVGAVLREENFIEIPLEMVSARHEIKLYFSDLEGENLVLETRPVVLRESVSSEWYRLVVDGLIAGPLISGAAPVMPERTRLMSVSPSPDNRVCTVNFSREFVTNAVGGTETAKITLLALVNSLTELQGVSFVKIRVEGEELESYFGWDTLKPLERNDPQFTTD